MKALRLPLFIFLLLLLLSTGSIGEEYETYPKDVKIRVLLSRYTDTAFFSIEAGKYKLLNTTKNETIAAPENGELWFVKHIGNNVFMVGIDGGKFTKKVRGTLYLKPINEKDLNVIRYSGTRYRDGLKFYGENNNILVINVLSIEKYLYGVLGKEIGTFAEMEALKAQAVASRTYALSCYSKANKYDVGIDTDSQVYGGYDAELLPGGDRVIKAVNATKGEVLYYDNKIISAFFHSNSGGYTANSEDVWGEYIPYLRAVPSPYDVYAAQYPVQTSSGWPGNTYQWEKNFTKKELVDKIQEWNSSHTGEDQIRVGKIMGIEPAKVKEDTGRRVVQLNLIGTRGIKSFYRNNIRWILGLKSTNFDVETNATVYIENGQGELIKKSNGGNFEVITAGNVIRKLATYRDNYKVIGFESDRWIKKYFTKLTIRGFGYGHGLGMSQWGARGMANRGFKYNQILEHYYNQGNEDGKLQIRKYYNKGS